MPKVIKTDAEWKKQLTPEQYLVARNKGTEAAFCGTLLDNHQDGVYSCICCGLPLFSSSNKFDSGTGWPSFFQPIAKENVIEHPAKGHDQPHQPVKSGEENHASPAAEAETGFAKGQIFSPKKQAQIDVHV
jgi:methionine-R-sulfoxide reductase